MSIRKIVILEAIILVILTGMVVWFRYLRSREDIKLKSMVTTEAALDMEPHPHKAGSEGESPRASEEEINKVLDRLEQTLAEEEISAQENPEEETTEDLSHAEPSETSEGSTLVSGNQIAEVPVTITLSDGRVLAEFPGKLYAYSEYTEGTWNPRPMTEEEKRRYAELMDELLHSNPSKERKREIYEELNRINAETQYPSLRLSLGITIHEPDPRKLADKLEEMLWKIESGEMEIEWHNVPDAYAEWVAEKAKEELIKGLRERIENLKIKFGGAN